MIEHVRFSASVQSIMGATEMRRSIWPARRLAGLHPHRAFTPGVGRTAASLDVGHGNDVDLEVHGDSHYAGVKCCCFMLHLLGSCDSLFANRHKGLCFASAPSVKRRSAASHRRSRGHPCCSDPNWLNSTGCACRTRPHRRRCARSAADRRRARYRR